MKTRQGINILLVLLLLVLLITSGCGQSGGAEATTEKDYSSMVADDSETIDYDSVVLDGMTPIEGKDVKDGTYPIVCKSSSTMFPVTDCILTVDKGEMTAELIMSGKGYLNVYPGTALEAAAADESELIPFEENDEGKHTFTIPVKALNAGVDCAALSKRKMKWYNRQLCFRADSLPLDALAPGVFVTAESLNLADGEYSIEMTLGGGTGRADVESPLTLKVKKGKCIAVIVWSSPNYDYMIVDGKKYDPVSTEGNSTFEIPVKIFDLPVTVIADTTAMSKPYEIEYTMRFDSGSVTPK